VARYFLQIGEDKMTNSNGPDDKSKKMIGMWLGIGVAIGAGIGVAIKNIAVGAGAGVAVGAAIGILLSRRKKE
jgi:hypothetical protein